ncbi:Urease accessory protein F [Porphyridium purpureum]|uniref:Urease accessory protein F n=1 Tax=Porphyridium purpureum TaxID=35688 RepID=A0A5J4YYN2_PORPP|nr:Urease accessory protein F [Porphyridium purpureum]|eukprot:POR1328..scf208_2
MWNVWMLLDSAFPSGGFVQSNGLEASLQCGVLAEHHGRHGADARHTEPSSVRHLVQFSLQSLHASARCVLPFARAAWMRAGRLSVSQGEKVEKGLLAEILQLDELLDERLSAVAITSESSRAQGAALLNTIYQAELAGSAADSSVKVLLAWKQHIVQRSAPGHFAVVFGCVIAFVCSNQEVSNACMLSRLFLFWQARALLSAGVRLGMVGAIASQKIMQDLGPAIEILARLGEEQMRACIHGSASGDHDWCGSDFIKLMDHLAELPTSTSPLLDNAACAHAHLYSRLFTS